MASGKCATIKSLDLDSSDNITEDVLGKFLERFVLRDDFYLMRRMAYFVEGMVHSWRDWLCLGWGMSLILCGTHTFQNLSMPRYW